MNLSTDQHQTCDEMLTIIIVVITAASNDIVTTRATTTGSSTTICRFRTDDVAIVITPRGCTGMSIGPAVDYVRRTITAATATATATTAVVA